MTTNENFESTESGGSGDDLGPRPSVGYLGSPIGDGGAPVQEHFSCIESLPRGRIWAMVDDSADMDLERRYCEYFGASVKPSAHGLPKAEPVCVQGESTGDGKLGRNGTPIMGERHDTPGCATDPVLAELLASFPRLAALPTDRIKPLEIGTPVDCDWTSED